MYLFFPTSRLNLVFAVNCFSFLSQILDDAKVEFTALKDHWKLQITAFL